MCATENYVRCLPVFSQNCSHMLTFAGGKVQGGFKCGSRAVQARDKASIRETPKTLTTLDWRPAFLVSVWMGSPTMNDDQGLRLMQVTPSNSLNCRCAYFELHRRAMSAEALTKDFIGVSTELCFCRDAF